MQSKCFSRVQLELRESRGEVAEESPLRARLPGGGITQEQTLHTTGFLGLREDISSSGLLRKAAAAGMGVSTGAGPAALEAAYRQALADTESFKAYLKQVRTLASLTGFVL